MFNVYILRSKSDPSKLYKGFTTLEVSERIKEHNRGNVDSTRKFIPWEIIWHASFETQKLATDFEKYLKSASGIAFMRKRLINWNLN